jgi:hypothetical protein
MEPLNLTDLTALVKKLAQRVPELSPDGDEQEEYCTMLEWFQIRRERCGKNERARD